MKKITDYDTLVYTQCLLFVTMFFVMMCMAQHRVVYNRAQFSDSK